MNKSVEKTRYNDKELFEFQEIINEKLKTTRQQLNLIENQLEELADNPDIKVKGLDDAIGTEENERLTSMAARLHKYIKHLDNALLRINNKVYGICRESGKLISKERLKAVPHATLSIEAKLHRKR